MNSTQKIVLPWAPHLQKRKRLLTVAYSHIRFIFALSRLPRLLSEEELDEIERHGVAVDYLFKKLYQDYSAFYPHLVTCCLSRQIRRAQKNLNVPWG